MTTRWSQCLAFWHKCKAVESPENVRKSRCRKYVGTPNMLEKGFSVKRVGEQFDDDEPLLSLQHEIAESPSEHTQYRTIIALHSVGEQTGCSLLLLLLLLLVSICMHNYGREVVVSSLTRGHMSTWFHQIICFGTFFLCC